MATKLIELADGTLIEVEVQPHEARPISGGAAEKVLNATLDQLTPMVLRVARPLVAAWGELSQEMDVEEAQIDLGFNFESEGNLYLAKASAGANINISFTLKARRGAP
jgi:hypothetical protein